jgi:hypothetical protein
MTPATDGRWRRVADLPFQTLDEETLVVNPARREVHLLNDTATRIWELCASPRTVDEVVAKLADEYDAPAEDLRRAVVELFDGLRDKSLIVNA